jgi:hypothetical protein
MRGEGGGYIFGGIMMRWISIFATLTLAACSTASPTTSSGSSSLARFKAVATEKIGPVFAAEVAGEVSAADLHEMTDCMISAMALGASDKDLDAMTTALNGDPLSRETRDHLAERLGPQVVHGAVVPIKIGDPSSYAGGVPHYQDGTPVKAGDEMAVKRILQRATGICPDLASRYRDLFRA